MKTLGQIAYQKVTPATGRTTWRSWEQLLPQERDYYERFAAAVADEAIKRHTKSYWQAFAVAPRSFGEPPTRDEG